MVHFTNRGKCPLCLTCEAEARYGTSLSLVLDSARKRGIDLFPPESVVLVDVVCTSETINGVATEELRVGFRATDVG